MQAKLTRSQLVSWIKSSIGHQYDVDKFAAFQCFDYANAGWLKLYNHTLAGEGAKDIVNPKWNDLTKEAKVYKNTPKFLPKPGDLVVWGSHMGNGYGHVAWVLLATLDYIVVVEQNWLGGGWTTGDAYNAWGWECATKRVHGYDNPMWFVRPNFKPEPKSSKPKETWNWKGKFTANYTVKVRKSPGLKGKVVRKDSWIFKNQWVKFVSITKKDGFWWAKFKYPTNPSSGYFYMAIARITDKKERIKKEKDLYGRIKWY